MERFFAKNGWAVVRQAVAPEVVAALDVAATRLVPTPTALVQLPAPRTLDAVFAPGAHVGRLGAQALGCERVQLLQDGLLFKPPGDHRVEWHRDVTYTGYLRPPATISVRLALTPSTVETGCLYVLGRSHETPWSGDTDVFGDIIAPGAVADLSPAELDAAIPVELEPGDVSLHHCLTFHGSFENRSSQVTRVLVTHVFDAACTVDETLLPEGARAHFTTDDDGHLSATRFPLL